MRLRFKELSVCNYHLPCCYCYVLVVEAVCVVSSYQTYMADDNDHGMSKTLLPRVLVVSRRSIRKNKFIDYVGEYHLDLLVSSGAIPIIVPRVAGIQNHLNSFDPIHGILLCEGEDVDPSLYSNPTTLSQQDIDEIRHRHRSDTAVDHEKDSIELTLTNLCLNRQIPILGICRGSQLLNVACGGTLFQDLEIEMEKTTTTGGVVHINYENYDRHRHCLRVVEGTPLDSWFKEGSIDEKTIMVNSYHHQGVKRLAERFVPMAFADDGLIEGFYDPSCYDLDEGKFIVGLQFHPERMRRSDSDEFEYNGCKSVYQDFVKAVIAYQKKTLTNTCVSVPNTTIVKVAADKQMEKRRKIIMFGRFFPLKKRVNHSFQVTQEAELDEATELLELNTMMLDENVTRCNFLPADVVGRTVMGNK